MTLDHLSELAALTAEFARQTAEADPDAPVAACPGWDVFQLVAHLGQTHAWAATVNRDGGPVWPGTDVPGSRDPSEVSRWYAERASDLVHLLGTVDPAEPCWNFSGVHQTRGFWPRRHVHETRIHLVDLVTAVGGSSALLPGGVEHAADGVSEVFEVFRPRQAVRGFPMELTAPVTVVADDARRAWRLTPVEGGLPDFAEAAYTAGPPDGDHVRADAFTLHRLLWKRATADDVEIGGDAGRVRRWLASPLVP